MFNKVILITILLLVGSQAQHLNSNVQAKFDELVKTYHHEAPIATQGAQENVNAFTKGFVEGISSAKLFEEIKACIADDQEVEADIIQAIQLIRTKNPEKVKEGIQLLGKAVEIIPVAAQECRAADADIQKLINLIHSFTNPKSFLYYVGKSLIINHVEVIAEINHIVDAYSNKDFNKLGFWVAKAMDTILLGDKNMLRQEMANFINSQNVGWTAAVPAQFEAMTLEDLKARLIPVEMMRFKSDSELTVMDYQGTEEAAALPKEFDSRKQWGNCVHAIRNQAQCGSCWAFAATEVLSDRFCIASDKKTDVVLSPQYLVSCDKKDHGCQGGNILFSWNFLVQKGTVTDECLPYVSGDGTDPVRCFGLKCKNGSKLKSYYAKKGTIASLPNVASIQTNIMTYRPVEGGFMVYEDFKLYNGGVYKHTSGKLLGGHAIKIIGWGQENGTNYWICANSWTEKWGENGFFRIAFGEVEIESYVVAGQADLAKAGQEQNFNFWF